MYTSMTPRQFRRRFRTERDCIQYLIKRKWPDGFRCPRCGHDHKGIRSALVMLVQ